jgi:membrane-associated protein
VDALLSDLIYWVLRFGPSIIFLVACAETAVFLGLLLPAGPIVLLGGFLASRGHFTLTEVMVATCAGAFLGDQIGYGIGRRYGLAVAGRGGVVGRIWRRYETRATALFRRRSVVAVSIARFLAFVRTLMPWFAGMSRLPYRRFVMYDLLGVFAWSATSVATGYLAGESWRVLADTIGTVSGWLVLIALVFAIGVTVRRKRMARRFERALLGPEPPPRRRRRLAPIALRLGRRGDRGGSRGSGGRDDGRGVSVAPADDA